MGLKAYNHVVFLKSINKTLSFAKKTQKNNSDSTNLTPLTASLDISGVKFHIYAYVWLSLFAVHLKLQHC